MHLLICLIAGDDLYLVLILYIEGVGICSPCCDWHGGVDVLLLLQGRNLDQ